MTKPSVTLAMHLLLNYARQIGIKNPDHDTSSFKDSCKEP